MVLVTAWVAEVDVGANETLLVAQQDHDLCQERGEERKGKLVCREEGADAVCSCSRTYMEPGHVSVVVVLSSSGAWALWFYAGLAGAKRAA